MTAPLISLQQVAKRFGGVQALIDVSVQFNAYEIHALLGENGAGKSTLIRILTGVHEADSGQVLVRGEPVEFRRPADAIARGIAVVPQERTLVPSLSVAENIMLGRRPTHFGLVDYGSMYRQAQSWLDHVDLDVSLHRRADTLRVAEAQMVEIARALAAEADVLVLDEPTASLGAAEVRRLFAVLDRLRGNGVAVVFVSHKLDEVLEICDRATVLRDGAVVAQELPVDTLDREGIIAFMIGRNVDFEPIRDPDVQTAGEPVLELSHLATDAGHEDLSLTVCRGEVVGIYGLVGAGRTELAHAIIGESAVTAGSIKVDGQVVQIRSVRSAVRDHAIAYLSEDRKSTGLILSQSIFSNVAIGIRDRLSGLFGWLRPQDEAATAVSILAALSTRYADGNNDVSSLSGGNQQKVSLAKWLATEPQLLIVDEPTVGIDVGTKDQIHRLLREIASGGVGVVVISSELPELARVADRVVVMHDFAIQGEIENNSDYESMSQQAMRLIHSPTKTKANMP